MKVGDKIKLVTEQYVGGNPLASMVKNESGELVMQTKPMETIAVVKSIREDNYTVELDDDQWWIISNDGKILTRGYY